MNTHKWIGVAAGIVTALFGILQGTDLTPLLGNEWGGILIAVIGALNTGLHAIPNTKG